MPMLESIILTLSHLSKAERAKLRAALDALEVKPADSPIDDSTLWLYDAASNLLGISLPFTAFLKTQFGPSWKTKSVMALNFLETTFPKASKTERLALARMLLHSLVANLRKRGLTPSIGLIATNIDSFPELFETAFPGYKANGIAHLVLSAMKRGSK